MLKSHSIIFKDFESEWYKKWAKELKQTTFGKGNFALKANKFWQNAVMAQILFERNLLKDGMSCIGFGVGKERLPALFANKRVKVTATDQDFTKEKAKNWNNDQLAQGAFSLNEDGICKPELFNKQVRFMSVDMNRIPKKLHDSYNFLWSNCALGHLGTLDKGLAFIENSLDCLKPGGWAVHTTEVNIISNEQTVTSGNTVIFRVQDIYKLALKLTQNGFLCAPFFLNPSNDKMDRRVTLDPIWGTDHTKILVEGHIATQVVVMIQLPMNRLGSVRKRYEFFKHYLAYKRNQRSLSVIRSQNPTIKLLTLAEDPGLEKYKITPQKKRVKISKKTAGPIMVEFLNESALALTGSNSLYNTKPIVLGTDTPVNRVSVLANKLWSSPNRPATELYKRRGSTWEKTDYIKPGEKFAFAINLSRSKKLMPHREDFSVIQEGGGVVPDSKVILELV